MKLALTQAAIATTDLDVQISVLDDDRNEFDGFTKLYDETADPKENLMPFENFAPGSRKKFKLELTNKSASELRLSLILSEILCDNQELAENIIIGTNGFEGFSAAYPEPTVKNMLLSEGLDETSGGFTLIDLVKLPPKTSETDNNTIVIYFYVMFSASGTEALEGLEFNIGKLNFVTV